MEVASERRRVCESQRWHISGQQAPVALSRSATESVFLFGAEGKHLQTGAAGGSDGVESDEGRLGQGRWIENCSLRKGGILSTLTPV